MWRRLVATFKNLPALSAATTTFEKANKAYGAPVRGRRRQRPPSDFRLAFLRAAHYWKTGSKASPWRVQHAEAERMVTLLEMNNIVSRDAELE